jgi:hypothetical protein
LLNLFTLNNLKYIGAMESNGRVVFDEPELSGGMKHLPPADLIDPVIEEYKKGLDLTLIAENLKRTPHERAERMGATIDWINQWHRQINKSAADV